MFTPRPKQAEVLAYAGGRMGVSAVPGSGKTQTLSALAARLVSEGGLDDDQEVLIVTLVNSAVDNFSQRLRSYGILPNVGYRVRTLHGLAHDIVRDRPGLVGLPADFSIVDDRDARQILQEAAEAWIAANPDAAAAWLNPDLDERKADWVRRDHWPKLVADLGGNFIRLAKDLELTPALLRERMKNLPGPDSTSSPRSSTPSPLLDMGLAIYTDYQRSLAYRGAVDYDDLIRLALQALQLDGDFLARLRRRWPYILEDEAQDSSRLQEEILRLLTGENSASGSGTPEESGSGKSGASASSASHSRTPGWVRVGDPNQAIFETFTTASPRYLRDFLLEPGVIARALPNSGRSTASIMALANALVDWSRTQHPVRGLRDALAPTHIEPAPAGDPQPNPPDDPDAVRLIGTKYTVADELAAVVTSLRRWLPDNGDKTVAVLVPRNERGEAVVNALKAAGIEYVELLKSTGETRAAAGALANIVAYLAEPTSPRKLATAFEVWRRADRDDPDAKLRMEAGSRALRRCRQVEEFLWPRGWAPAGWPAATQDSLDCLELPDDEPLRVQLRQFRDLVRRWQGATTLPADQLILAIGQDLFDRPADLAVAYKLAGLIRAASDSHPEWRLPELNEEMITIARNERKFIGFSESDTGFDPDAHRGKVVVATVHKAKGLEWDRVYLMSVNSYDFPSALPGDSFIAERWYIRDQLNLEAEALALLETMEDGRQATGDGQSSVVNHPSSVVRDTGFPPLGVATEEARIEYAAERLRLLYVGITRAKHDLIITWNTGRAPGKTLTEAAPLIALRTWWEGRRAESVERRA